MTDSPSLFPDEPKRDAPLGEHAYARRTDPETSWEAARSVSKKLRETQTAVLTFLRQYGPMTDEKLVAEYALLHATPSQSPSGLRTRRGELVRQGLVRDTGRREKLRSGSSGNVWEAS